MSLYYSQIISSQPCITYYQHKHKINELLCVTYAHNYKLNAIIRKTYTNKKQ